MNEKKLEAKKIKEWKLALHLYPELTVSDLEKYMMDNYDSSPLSAAFFITNSARF